MSKIGFRREPFLGGSSARAAQAIAAAAQAVAIVGSGNGQFPDGTAANPALRFASDLDTGMFRPGANQIGWATNGAQRMLLDFSALTLDVPLAGTATTQSPTDTTDNRVPRLRSTGGIFGLGGLDAPVVTDFDDSTLRTGFYRTTGATVAGTFPPGITQGTFAASGPLVVQRHDGGSVTQWWSSLNDAQVWTRRFSGSWTGWQRATRILGTVSQSGGAATGAIIERGSNANGEFVRFADGMLVCTRTTLSTPNASTALGALFRSGDVAWTFPATFAAAPIVVGEVDDLDTWLTTGVPSTTAVTLRAVAAVTKGAALNIRAQAIGRWF